MLLAVLLKLPMILTSPDNAMDTMVANEPFLHGQPWISPWISNELDITFHVIASQLSVIVTSSANDWDIISRTKTRASESRGRCVKMVVFSSFMDSLCRVRNKIMYVLPWQTISALTRVLFWCLFPSESPSDTHEQNAVAYEWFANQNVVITSLVDVKIILFTLSSHIYTLLQHVEHILKAKPTTRFHIKTVWYSSNPVTFSVKLLPILRFIFDCDLCACFLTEGKVCWNITGLFVDISFPPKLHGEYYTKLCRGYPMYGPPDRILELCVLSLYFSDVWRM